MIARRRLIFVLLGMSGIAIAVCLPIVRNAAHPLMQKLRGRPSVADRLREFTAAEQRVRTKFAQAGVAYPPDHVALLGLKDEMRLEVYAGDPPRRIATYPVLAASGRLGPKLREGDNQVPEGVYAVDSLNPDSGLHVALRLGYPNDMDRSDAPAGTKLGGDIMIHGGASSVGCLAVGDPASEDLFVLTAAVGVEHVTAVIAPVDLRTRPLPPSLDQPD